MCVHVCMCLSVCVCDCECWNVVGYIYTVLVLFAECHDLVVDNSDNVQCHRLLIKFF